ncbi:MAG: hypothetical protein AAB571_09865 [Chloroflexota bacterium]
MFSKRPLDYYILWGVAAISLLLNLYTIASLISVRQQAGIAFANAAKSLEAVKTSRVEYTVKIDKEIPFAANVPINLTVQVPINQTIPLDTIVNVPIRTPLGTFPIDVPINTKIPINFTIDFPINKSFPIATNVPVKMDVPIVINLGETSFGKSLDDLQVVLNKLAKELGQ